MWVYKHVSCIKIEFSQKSNDVEELRGDNLYVRLQSAGSLVELQVRHTYLAVKKLLVNIVAQGQGTTVMTLV